jgi:hydroxyacylglutathione hydrolase
MKVETIPVGPFQSNCHLVIGEDRQAIVVDPGDDAEILVAAIRRAGLAVAAYAITHGHMDHLFALAEVHAAFPAPIGLHPLDARWAFSASNVLPPYYEAPPAAPPEIARAFAEGQTWTDAGLTYRILELPGHSPGSVGLWFERERVLFAGDVLFQGSVGRTDLPGGDGRTLARSLGRLLELPLDTVVHCGHGDETTLREERETNFFLRQVAEK